MDLAALNALDPDAATRAFLGCCGSTRWASGMTVARPFASADAMAEAADRIWASLDPNDWLEAFASHPRIGAGGADAAGRAGGAGGAGVARWASDEQAGVQSATSDLRHRLADGNRSYEARFGYIFIVCATEKSAGEMLAILELRLRNDPEVELTIAAEEQRRITRLRLAKLIADTPLHRS